MTIEELAKLSDEELRFKCAELCGWTRLNWNTWEHKDSRMSVWPTTSVPNYPADLNAALSLLETDADYIPIHGFNIADFVRCLALLTGAEVDEEPETCDFFRFLKASPRQITIAFIAVKQQPVEVKGGGE